MTIPDKIHRETIIGKLSYLYGREIVEKIDLEDVKYVLSSTGRVRDVYIKDRLVFTLRMSDGYLLPTIEGCKYVKNSVVVNEEAVPFIKSGRSVIAKSIVDIYGDPIPGEEVKVCSRDGQILAVGRLLLSEDEIRNAKRGIAVKVRHSSKS